HLGPVNFQPAQLAVIAGIMVLALFLTQFREMHPMLRLLLCGAIAAAPCLLILMQPDLGEVIIWVPVLLTLLFVGGLPLRYLICVILIGLAFIPISINRSLRSGQAAGRGKASRPQTRKLSLAFCLRPPCITTTFSPRSASSGDLLEECF